MIESGDVMHASIPIFSHCKSLAPPAVSSRAKFTSALLRDRILHAKLHASPDPTDTDLPVHSCPNLHEVRINASLTYRASLLKIKGRHKGATFTILLDDGSAINIVSRRKVTQLGLQTHKLSDPIAVAQFQGHHVDTCSEAVFIPISVLTDNSRTQEIHTDTPFIVMDMDASFDMIMGMPVHEQFDLQKSYKTRQITFHDAHKSFTLHAYDKHINNVHSAAVISHIAANHLHNTAQISESFCVFVTLPPAPVFSVQDTSADFITTPTPVPAPGQPQPEGVAAPQPAAPNQPVVGKHLSPSQEAEVRTMLDAFSNVFKEPSGINPHLSPFHIKQKTGVPEKPFIRYARRLTLEERAAVQLTIEKFLSKGWIQPSDSEWGAPIMFIRKLDGSLRAVVDYRQLNSQSSSDGVKLPLLSECLQSMAGKQWYSKLDLADGYFQVPMHSDSIPRTGFTTGTGLHYEWRVMPMGLKGAPNHFCRIMHNALNHLIKQGVCVVYLDDILIASNTFEEHIKHISLVLQALAAVDLRAKPSKCQFACISVDFLGHHIGPQGIGTQPSKVEAIISYPVPTCASQLDSFLGLVGFYSPLLPNLSTACALLRHKVHNWHDSGWTTEHQSAYDNIKHLASSAPFLHAADPHREFHIHLDASKVGVGASLSQDFGAGLQPVAYFSRKLLGYQTRYLNGKRELLALMLALRQWRHWVGGSGVHVCAYTDHSNNTMLFSPSFSVDDTTIAGWLLELQRDYPGLRIVHVPGSENKAADALSRHPAFADSDYSDPIISPTTNPNIIKTDPIIKPDIDPQPDHLVYSDGYLTPDLPSDNFQSCDSARSTRNSSSDGSDMEITMTKTSAGFIIAVPGRDSIDSNASSDSSDIVMFQDGKYGLIGCVLGFKSDSMQPIFSDSAQMAVTDKFPLHDKCDSQVLPMYAFTGAALTLHPNANLLSKFTHAYTSDAYLLAHKQAFIGKDNLFYRPSGALYVPAACVKLVLELEHDQGGHHGQVETERRVRSRYWFPNLHALVKEYVRGCITCGKSKPPSHTLRGPLGFREFSDTQWDQISMDFVCGLPVVNGGFDRVLTVVDRGLTKRAHFIKCKSTHTAEHIAQLFLDNVYVHHGLPSSIICDQDPLFMSHFYKGLMHKLQVKLQPGAVYHPQSDGQSEVTNRILKTYLIKFCQDHPSQWHNFLFRAEFEYNYSQKPTGYSAFQLDMGRQPRRIEDVLVAADSHVPAVNELFEQQSQVIKTAKAALNRAFQQAAAQHDKKTRPSQVAVGDSVYLSTLHLNIPVPGGVRKFKQPFTGPFKVVKVSSSGNAATLELPPAWLAARTWNVEYLKPHNPVSSPLLDESADSLSSIAVRDDSASMSSDKMGGDPMHHQTAMTDPADALMLVSDNTASAPDIILPTVSRIVQRIADYRPARGKRKNAQYLLVFKDQPASESMWVDVSECSVFSGFQSALQEHQNRRLLRSSV